MHCDKVTITQICSLIYIRLTISGLRWFIVQSQFSQLLSLLCFGTFWFLNEHSSCTLIKLCLVSVSASASYVHHTCFHVYPTLTRRHADSTTPVIFIFHLWFHCSPFPLWSEMSQPPLDLCSHSLGLQIPRVVQDLAYLVNLSKHLQTRSIANEWMFLPPLIV